MNIFIKIKITFFIIIFLAFSDATAQEFNQFYNIPHYYNSAFAGIKKCSSISVNNNILPVATGVNFKTNNLLIDWYIPKISGGLKFGVAKKTSPQDVFSSLNLTFAYSYHIKLSYKYRLSLSVQSVFNQENFNSANLIFPNMISPYSTVILPNNEPIINKTCRGFKFAGGFVLYNNDSYFSVYIDNFYSIYADKENNAKTAVIILSEKEIFHKSKKTTITLNSMIFSSKYSQNISTGGILKINQLNFGIFSKQNYFEKKLTNGIEAYFSYSYKKFLIAYSYDFYFGNLLRTKSSSHEIHIKFHFLCREKNNNNTIICPAYKL